LAKKNTDEVSFESSFKRLEDILDKLENEIDDTSLEEIMSYYQEGLELLKHCRVKLNETEIKIEKIKSDSKS
jgi:exodeoxyribonuclease VII small subunit